MAQVRPTLVCAVRLVNLTHYGQVWVLVRSAFLSFCADLVVRKVATALGGNTDHHHHQDSAQNLF